MPKHQSSQILKLYDCVVSKRCSLVTFFALYPNTNMCRLYHIYVIEPVTDAKYDIFVFQLSLDKFDCCCFLYRRRPVQDHRVGF